jgi:hypothetical protein
MTRFTDAERKRRQIADTLASVFDDNVRFYTNTYKGENTRNLESVALRDIGTQPRVQKDVLLMLPYTSGSDYSGGSVTRSNYEILIERWEGWRNENGDTVAFPAHGGHGSYGVVVNLDAATLEQLEEVNETLQELSDYPVLDEDHMTRLEARWAREEYKAWIEYEFRSALRDKYPRLQDIDLDEDKLEELFWAMFYAADGYFFNETGPNMVPEPGPEELVEKVAAEQFEEFTDLLR